MASNLSQILSVTEPHLKKSKLDELGMMETLESVKRETEVDTIETLESEDSDIERQIEAGTLRPQHFESGELVELCKSALAYYESKHPQESYEFVSGHGGFQWFHFRHTQYRLEFLAKNLRENGNPVRNFEAYVFYHPYDGPEGIEVEECVLWKDDEMEPEFSLDFEPETPLEDLEDKEFSKIIEVCKSSLEFYKENHPEEPCYEFVKVQKVKRWVSNGVQYILVFHAKNPKVNTLSTFKASAFHVKRAIEVAHCELR